MDPRVGTIAASAARFHGVVPRSLLEQLAISTSTVHRWVAQGLLVRLGPRSLALAGAPPTWHRALAGGLVETAPAGVLAGRSGARLLALDGFDGDHVEVLVPRAERRTRVAGAVVRTTTRPIERSDVQRVDGLRCLRAERLVLEAPRCGLSRVEIENAIDSAVRLRLLSERRRRERALARHTPGRQGCPGRPPRWSTGRVAVSSAGSTRWSRAASSSRWPVMPAMPPDGSASGTPNEPVT